MLLVSPVSVVVAAVRNGKVTAVPSLGLAGAVLPCTRRTMTRARSLLEGLVQDKVRLVALRLVACRLLTGPGAVMSVVLLMVVPFERTLPVVSLVNTA